MSNSPDEYRISLSGGDGDHPGPVGMIAGLVVILVNPGTPDEKLVRFSNVPLNVVEEAIAHVNDNSDPVHP